MTHRFQTPSTLLRPPLRSLAGALLLLLALLRPRTAAADTAAVVKAAQTLIATSVASGASPTVQTSAYTLAIAKQWTNLPGGTRNGPTIGGGPAALSTDLSDTVPSGQTISPRAAALALCETALSADGYTNMDEIRYADNVIRATDNSQSWNRGNYHIAILGTPSTTAAWMLQISGHHLTHNITYNGPYVSATPMFIGTEPPDWYSIGTKGATTEKAVVVGKVNGTTTYEVSYPNVSSSSTTATTTNPGIASATHRAPLEAQRAACYNLSVALQADATNYASSKLSGTFTDVVLGVTNAGDGNFPFKGSVTYPTSGRGVLYSSLSTAEKALVKAYIEAWVKLQATDVSASLLADYESDAALAQTYVGVGVGAGGTPDFTAGINNAETTPLNSQHSYIRVDGPRVWIEFVVQEAVAFRNEGWVHYHSLWRDKLADYGNEFGGYLDTTSTATTYTRPAITTQPASGSTNTALTVTATGTATLNYQWYQDGTAISGATSASYTPTAAGSYYVVVTNLYGATTSATATVTANGTTTTPPTISTTTLPAGTPGTAYSATLAASGGTTPYTWSLASGSLPDGLSLSSAGVISGTPTAEGTSSFTVQVTDHAGQTATQALTITVSDATLTVSSSSFTGTVGTAFSATLAATGGDGTYSWSLSSGTLPAGLSLSSAGVLSGTPTAEGSSSFVVQVADGDSHTATGTITVTISAASTGTGGTGGTGTGGTGTGSSTTLPTAAVGIFTGTIARESTVNGNLGGRIVMVTTAAGKFTVNLLQGVTVRAAVGKVAYTSGSNPTVAATVTWPSLGNLTLALTIDSTTGALTGMLTSTSGSAAIAGWRYAWNATSAPATTRAGYYTVALDLANAADEGQTSIPQGVGFARVIVAKSGIVTVAGQTADQTAFVTVSHMGANGEILVYEGLPGGKGSIAGKLILTPGTTLSDNSITGTLTWSRPATATRLYAAGFGPVSLSVQGKYMAASAATSAVAGLPATGTTATLAFTEGGLSASAVDPDVTFTYSASGVVSLSSTNPGKDTLVIVRSNGIFAGTFTLVDGTLTRKVTFRGALVRLASGNVIGAGYFLLPQIPASGETNAISPYLSGQVVIEQAPPCTRSPEGMDDPRIISRRR